MASIYLIRHGQASFGQRDYDQLSALGLEQAQVLGRALSLRIAGFAGVLSGTMQRQQQTAEACLDEFTQASAARVASSLEVGEHIAFEPYKRWQDARWNEYDHADILQGLGPDFASAESINHFIKKQSEPKVALEESFNAAMQRWMSGDYDDEYVETWEAYQSRIHSALDSVLRVMREPEPVTPYHDIAVFTSGGVIAVIAQALLGVPSERMMQLNWTLMNCAVTKLVVTRDRLFVATLNEHVHFEQLYKRRLITYK